MKMKKKLTINTLALGNLKQRRKQYTTMILSIFLAMVFTSGIMFFISSMFLSMNEYSRNSLGGQDGFYIDADESVLSEGKEKGVFSDYGLAHIIGYAVGESSVNDIWMNSEGTQITYKETDDTLNQKGGISVGWLDSNARTISRIKLLEGTYPEKDGEIAIESSMLRRLGFKAKVGDKITLTLYPQNEIGVIDKPVKKTYTLTGIVSDKYVNFENYLTDSAEIPCAFVAENTQTEIGGKERLVAYYNQPVDKNNINRLYSFFNSKNLDIGKLEAIAGNSETYLFWNDNSSTNLVFATVFATVLAIASCVAIVNAFNSNLQGRKKQIGMLKAIGATKRQIINIFGREAFIISLISTPLSLLASYFGVKLIIHLISNKLVFVPNLPVLLGCGTFSVMCVMLASLIPLLSVSSISPVQSIRDISITRRMKKRKIKSQKEFDTPKLIAKRNLVFYRSKQCVVSIFLTITIFISCFGFSMVKDFKNDSNYELTYDYQLTLQGEDWSLFSNYSESNYGYSENDKLDILSSEYVKEVVSMNNCTALVNTDSFSDYMKTLNMTGISFYDLDSSNYTSDNIQKIYDGSTEFYRNEYISLKDNLGFDCELFPVKINGTDKALIEKLKPSVIDGKINYDKLNSGEEVILVAPQEATLNVGNDFGSIGIETDSNAPRSKDETYYKTTYCDYKAGDKIDVSILSTQGNNQDNIPNKNNTAVNNKTVTIGAIISDYPPVLSDSGFYWQNNFNFITTTMGMNQFINGKKYVNINVYLNSECNDDIDTKLSTEFEQIADSVKWGRLSSKYGFENERRRMENSVNLAMISVIVLMMSISASIINNSLTSRIRESKKEMGTLRAVGASQKELVNSYIRQLLSMFGWGIGIGFGIYLVAFCIVNAYRKYLAVELMLPFEIWQTVIACAVFFAICSINLWLRIKSEMKNSIVENIREL